MKNLLRTLYPIILLSLFSTGVLAEPTARIKSYGIYEYRALLSAMPGTDSSIGTSDKTVLVRETTKITKQIGTIFGFFWAASGYQENTPLKIMYRLKHPAMRMPDGSISFGSDDSFMVYPTGPSYEMASAFQFSAPYELVAGTWEMIVFLNDHEAIAKTFNVD